MHNKQTQRDLQLFATITPESNDTIKIIFPNCLHRLTVPQFLKKINIFFIHKQVITWIDTVRSKRLIMWHSNEWQLSSNLKRNLCFDYSSMTKMSHFVGINDFTEQLPTLITSQQFITQTYFNRLLCEMTQWNVNFAMIKLGHFKPE